MALSPNATRALEQVKMGLYMLYGADYFTEDEWMKIDCLLHKGKYVLTNGPTPNILHEEELISFGECTEDILPPNIQTNAIHSFQPSTKDVIIVSEQQIPSPSSSEDSHPNEHKSPKATSTEPSSNAEAVPIPLDDPAGPELDSLKESTEVSASSPPNRPLRTTTGLPPGITQEQLDEARKMQAAMTKAGQKSRPTYKREEEALSRSRWADDLPEENRVEEAYPSPAPSERDNRINSWASEVNAHQDSLLSHAIVEETLPEHPVDPKALAKQEFIRIHGRQPDSLADYWQPKNPEHYSNRVAPTGIETVASTNTVADPKVIAEEEFIKIHGRKPKSINDFYQPNNPNHFSQRPISRASNTTTKTAKTAKTGLAGPQLSLKINPGSTYVAQSGQSKSHGSDLKLDVRRGDHIRVMKYVSGIMWVGSNLQTKQTGQFSEAVFKKSASTQKSETLLPIQSTPAPSVSSFSIRHGIENVEWTNAAEWDDVSDRSASRPSAAAPTPQRPGLGGLSSSRFSVLADREPKSQPPARNAISLAMKVEFGKMVDEKVDEILKARGMTSTPGPSTATVGPARSRTINESLKPVPPKRNTCWFWATNKGCRFTAEECRDLHGYLQATAGEPTNLHMGKPTWGSLADASPTVGHADPDSFTVPEVDPSTSLSSEQKKGMTCWYWAQNGKCDYTAESCKYLHEHTSMGTAPRPWKKPFQWATPTWRRRDEVADGGTIAGHDSETAGWGDADGEKYGELVLEEVHAEDSISRAGWGVIGDGGTGGWGRDTPVQDAATGWGQQDRYKPPHIKALEEKAMIETVGW